jgi:aspartate/glutamate racemase
MEQDFYMKRLREHGLTVLVPDDLSAGATTTRTVTCASVQRVVTLDPENRVAESNESNNTGRIPAC